MSDTAADIFVNAARRKIRNGRAPVRCDEYEQTSKLIAECVHCGWSHAVVYYELGPELAAEKGMRYVAVGHDASIEYIKELPAGAEAEGLEEGNA